MTEDWLLKKLAANACNYHVEVTWQKTATTLKKEMCPCMTRANAIERVKTLLTEDIFVRFIHVWKFTVEDGYAKKHEKIFEQLPENKRKMLDYFSRERRENVRELCCTRYYTPPLWKEYDVADKRALYLAYIKQYFAGNRPDGADLLWIHRAIHRGEITWKDISIEYRMYAVTPLPTAETKQRKSI